MKKYTTKQLEAAFEFCRIVNERGGFRLTIGGDRAWQDVFYGLPDLTCLLNYPEDCEHLPLPPKKVMMQMWSNPQTSTVRLVPVSAEISYAMWDKAGEPFEFTYPKGVK